MAEADAAYDDGNIDVAIVKVGWEKIHCPGPKPTPRILQSCIAIGPMFVVHGGLCNKRYLDDTFFFNHLNRQWYSANIEGVRPPPVAGHSATGHQSDIVIFGGKTKDGYSNELWVLSLEKEEWAPLTDFEEQPQPRAFHSSAKVDNKFYIFGGESLSEDRSQRIVLNDLWCFDAVQLVWTQITFEDGAVPPPRRGASLTMMDEKLYLFGGEKFSDNGAAVGMNDLWHINITQENPKWEQIDLDRIRESNPNLLPLPRAFHSCVTLETSLVFFGGYCSTQKSCLNDIWEFNIAQMEFGKLTLSPFNSKEIPDTFSPQPRFGHFCVVAKEEGRLLLWGGGAKEHMPVVNNLPGRNAFRQDEKTEENEKPDQLSPTAKGDEIAQPEQEERTEPEPLHPKSRLPQPKSNLLTTKTSTSSTKPKPKPKNVVEAKQLTLAKKEGQLWSGAILEHMWVLSTGSGSLVGGLSKGCFDVQKETEEQEKERAAKERQEKERERRRLESSHLLPDEVDKHSIVSHQSHIARQGAYGVAGSGDDDRQSRVGRGKSTFTKALDEWEEEEEELRQYERREVSKGFERRRKKREDNVSSLQKQKQRERADHDDELSSYSSYLPSDVERDEDSDKDDITPLQPTTARSSNFQSRRKLMKVNSSLSLNSEDAGSIADGEMARMMSNVRDLSYLVSESSNLLTQAEEEDDLHFAKCFDENKETMQECEKEMNSLLDEMKKRLDTEIKKVNTKWERQEGIDEDRWREIEVNEIRLKEEELRRETFEQETKQSIDEWVEESKRQLAQTEEDMKATQEKQQATIEESIRQLKEVLQGIQEERDKKYDSERERNKADVATCEQLDEQMRAKFAQKKEEADELLESTVTAEMEKGRETLAAFERRVEEKRKNVGKGDRQALATKANEDDSGVEGENTESSDGDTARPNADENEEYTLGAETLDRMKGIEDRQAASKEKMKSLLDEGSELLANAEIDIDEATRLLTENTDRVRKVEQMLLVLSGEIKAISKVQDELEKTEAVEESNMSELLASIDQLNHESKEALEQYNSILTNSAQISDDILQHEHDISSELESNLSRAIRLIIESGKGQSVEIASRAKSLMVNAEARLGVVEQSVRQSIENDVRDTIRNVQGSVVQDGGRRVEVIVSRTEQGQEKMQQLDKINDENDKLISEIIETTDQLEQRVEEESEQKEERERVLADNIQSMSEYQRTANGFEKLLKEGLRVKEKFVENEVNEFYGDLNDKIDARLREIQAMFEEVVQKHSAGIKQAEDGQNNAMNEKLAVLMKEVEKVQQAINKSREEQKRQAKELARQHEAAVASLDARLEWIEDVWRKTSERASQTQQSILQWRDESLVSLRKGIKTYVDETKDNMVTSLVASQI
ncbi:putative Tip elongation aberrant protein 1 [Blattamonas nauphoetae]|uniref:Tip elongation aberrant protein 1 n=1 Tax=Blattamonas nauphoetae TaxID=2049346 RepID=A0ABQ9Y5Z8_9EUKA|nr:putative Tip elongation aberrant protein 1 [Blattamonas nauphoetae]